MPEPYSQFTVTISKTRYDAADTEAYATNPMSLDERNIWFFAFVPHAPRRVLFTCKDAFYAARRYYQHLSCAGNEIVDPKVLPSLLDKNGKIDGTAYEGRMPLVRSSNRPLWAGDEDMMILRTSGNPTWNSHACHAISGMQPLKISHVKYLIMDVIDFHAWVTSPASTDAVVFEGLKVLYLVASNKGRADYASVAEVGPGPLLEPALLDGERLRWGVETVTCVSSVEDILNSRRAGN